LGYGIPWNDIQTDRLTDRQTDRHTIGRIVLVYPRFIQTPYEKRKYKKDTHTNN